MLRRTFLTAFVAAALFACSPKPPEPAPPITVFAASSLQDVLTEAGEAYRAAGRGDVRFSFAGSPALARQIEQAPPADIFISADEQWMDYVAERGLIEEDSRVDLLTNRLALIAPADNTEVLVLAPGLDLASRLGPEGRLAMAAPEVPAGKYAEAALKTLGAWEGVRERTARGENVRAALQFVARGEAPYGVVYETDGKVEPAVRIVGLFPQDSHPPIVYPAAVLKGRGEAGADAFLEWLKGPEAGAVFEKYGFRRP